MHNPYKNKWRPECNHDTNIAFSCNHMMKWKPIDDNQYQYNNFRVRVCVTFE